MSGSLRVESRGRVLVITINRPEVRNAIDLATALAIAEALDHLDSDPELAVGVLTGAGKTFCAGMDLKAFLRGERPVVEGRGFAGFIEKPPAKPLIAAVEGHALAGGCELVLACDLVVMATGAVLGIPEVKRGLVAAAGGLLRLPRQLPQRLALELALTGEPLSSERAFELGLINRLVAPGETLSAAVALAELVASNGPLAVAATKEIMTAAADWPLSEAFDRQRARIRAVLDSNDAKEGAAAFAERRSPVWTGS